MDADPVHRSWQGPGDDPPDFICRGQVSFRCGEIRGNVSMSRAGSACARLVKIETRLRRELLSLMSLLSRDSERRFDFRKSGMR